MSTVQWCSKINSWCLYSQSRSLLSISTAATLVYFKLFNWRVRLLLRQYRVKLPRTIWQAWHIVVTSRRAWSCTRITYTKLSHKLLNTNVQNHRFYGKSDRCPCCNILSETLLHVFNCLAPDILTFRHKQQTILWNNLSLIDTLSQVLDTIKCGIMR